MARRNPPAMIAPSTREVRRGLRALPTRRAVACAVWAGALALLFTRNTAHAEAAVWLGVTRDATASVADGEAAKRATMAFFAQKTPSVRLFTVASARPQPSAELSKCETPRCAGPLAQAVSADFAVLVHIFAADGTPQSGSVSTAFVARDGVSYVGAERFGAGTGIASAEDATARALTTADERRARGPGPWLQVRASAGYGVRVDEGALHAAPYLERHEPGLHRVVVTRSDGTSLYEGLITLSDDPAQYADVDTRGLDTPAPSAQIAAPPAAHSTASTKDAAPSRSGSAFFRRARSPKNLYVGVPLAALGIALTAAGASHFVKRGDCSDASCSDVYTVNALSRALLAGGTSLAAAAGVAFFAVGVLREPALPPQGAILHFCGRF